MTQHPPQAPGASLHTRCTHCQAEYVLGPSSQPADGLQLHCAQCQQSFEVLSFPSNQAEQAQPGAAAQLLVRKLNGAMYDAQNLQALKNWITERRVSADDLVAVDGQSWQRAGNFLELRPLFEAQRLESQVPLTGSNPHTVRLPNPLLAGVPGAGSNSVAALQSMPLPTLTPVTAAPPLTPLQGTLQQPRLASQPAGVAWTAFAPSLTSPGSSGDEQMPAMPARRTTDDALFSEQFDASAAQVGRQRRGHKATKKRPRRLGGLLTFLVVLGGSLAGLRTLQPDLFFQGLDVLVRAPVSNLAAAQVKVGYQQLDRDTPQSIELAIETFERAVQMDAHYSEAHSGLAEAYLAVVESAQEAAQSLTIPVANETKLQARQRLTDRRSLTAALQKPLQLATEQLQTALALTPQSLAANRALAESIRLSGADWQTAQLPIARARAEAPSDPRLSGTLAAQLSATNPLGGMALLQQAVDTAPQNNRLRRRLASLLVRLDDRAGALHQVESILKVVPEHPQAQQLLSVLQPALGSALPRQIPAQGELTQVGSAPPDGSTAELEGNVDSASQERVAGAVQRPEGIPAAAPAAKLDAGAERQRVGATADAPQLDPVAGDEKQPTGATANELQSDPVAKSKNQPAGAATQAKASLKKQGAGPAEQPQDPAAPAGAPPAAAVDDSQADPVDAENITKLVNEAGETVAISPSTAASVPAAPGQAAGQPMPPAAAGTAQPSPATGPNERLSEAPQAAVRTPAAANTPAVAAAPKKSFTGLWQRLTALYRETFSNPPGDEPKPSALRPGAPQAAKSPAVPAVTGVELPATASYAQIIAEAKRLREGQQGPAALALYQRAMNLDTTSPAAYLGLGFCQLDANDIDGAARSFSTVLQLAPWIAEAQFGLGQALQKAGNRRDAQKHYRQVLAIAPDAAIAAEARQHLEELSR
jgi:predicted Zn finger-like uncharacterized protein